MRRNRQSRSERHIFFIAGWLFADVLVALMMLFLVTSVFAAPPKPPPVICGMDHQPDRDITLTVADPNGLRNQSSAADQQFSAQVKATFAPDAGNIAGLVEIFGGHEVGEGELLATGAAAILPSVGIVFSSDKTLIQHYWNNGLASNQVELQVFFYKIATSC